ncbi:MAG: N-acyl homoserine lactonase family protein [Acidibrevibacterium sp.]|uniref:N-acyl homoserine lactonase family protein n=1 Tax=Acidibrevibacterium sp. TaxID=2606776 RepID=UPI003D051B06
MWEVFALRYATQERMARENFLHPPDPHDQPMPMDYFFWLLRRPGGSGGEDIIVDTGFTPEMAQARKRRVIRPVPAGLAALGVDPASVRDVVITHLHYDHAGNLALFPNALFHLQEREMAFATGANMCFSCLRVAFEVEDVVAMVRALYADRVRFHDGEGAIAPGVSVHRVGGHTDGLQMVRVETARGPVVLASDASHFYANMERENPFPIVFNVGEMARGWHAARKLAGDAARVIPGHDPEIRRRYPTAGDDEIFALHLPPR